MVKKRLEFYEKICDKIHYKLSRNPDGMPLRLKQLIFTRMSDEEKKLGELITITSSKRIFYSEYVSSGVPFYRSKEIGRISGALPIDQFTIWVEQMMLS